MRPGELTRPALDRWESLLIDGSGMRSTV